MADTVFQDKYRQEFISGFERRQSVLRSACTTEAEIKARAAIFMVADSGGASAVTRGANGKIPGRVDNQTQFTCALEEWHDKVTKTAFDIERAQGDQRAVMQETTMAVINRKIDDLIIAELATATNDTGAATTFTLNKAMHALAILGQNNVPLDGQITGVLTPAAFAYLMQLKEFSSVDYVANKPFTNVMQQFRWAGINWMVHSGLPGMGTNAEKLFVFHKNAIGHAYSKGEMQTYAEYVPEDDYSYARCSTFMGAKLLQNSGVVVVNHDGSAFAAS